MTPVTQMSPQMSQASPMSPQTPMCQGTPMSQGTPVSPKAQISPVMSPVLRTNSPQMTPFTFARPANVVENWINIDYYEKRNRIGKSEEISPSHTLFISNYL